MERRGESAHLGFLKGGDDKCSFLLVTEGIFWIHLARRVGMLARKIAWQYLVSDVLQRKDNQFGFTLGSVEIKLPKTETGLSYVQIMMTKLVFVSHCLCFCYAQYPESLILNTLSRSRAIYLYYIQILMFKKTIFCKKIVIF